MPPEMNRREFLESATASAAAVTIVPRHVLGGPNFVAPSDKINVGYIGIGTQGIREIGGLLGNPEIQIVAVCDPEKDGNCYLEWGKGQVRDTVRALLEKPAWREGNNHTPGGRDVGRELVETYYANRRTSEKYKGCSVYADFRELLEKEKDLDAIKIMTPDHLHATIAMAAMKKGKHVMVQKPIANRVYEARLVIETARLTKLATHFSPWHDGVGTALSAKWIRDGAIGTLREIHNWSSRPVWPQYATIPTDRPQIPKGFDWDLWLGPVPDRPYHPCYTHTVFRGWYDFGAGPIADMGIYSLWPIFSEFNLDTPVSVEATPSHVVTVEDQVCVGIINDYSFPHASTIRFRFAAKGGQPPFDIVWWDGGVRPSTPEELISEKRELPSEGMLFVGDKGKILAAFRGESPRLVPEQRMRQYQLEKYTPAPNTARPTGTRMPNPTDAANRALSASNHWVTAIKGGPPSPGNFLNAKPISEAVTLAAVSLRSGKRIEYDSDNMKITNVPEANQYLVREYRKGWEL
jgi:hypothetical protein